MEATNAKTIETLERERERESLNIEDKGFMDIAKKLYIKYKELKIKLTNGIRKSDVRHQTSDVRYPTSDISVSCLIFLLYIKKDKK